MKIRYFNLLFVVFALVFGSGCASLTMRTADNFYDDLAYYDALRNYQKVAKAKNDPRAIIRTAECYRLLNFNKEAAQWYSLAMENNNLDPIYQFEYAKVLMKNGDYVLAKKYLNKYLLTDKNNASIKELINSCDSVERIFYVDTTMYSINLLSWNELSSSNFSPRFYKSGLMFVSDREHPARVSNRNPYTGKNTYDIFFVKLTEFDNWLKPEPIIGDVNGIFNEGPCAFTAGSDTMYFTRNNYLEDKASKNEDNLSTLKIFRAVFKNAEWRIDGELEISSKDYSVAHPTVSKDGNFMVFISDMPWGYGGTDLYASQKVNGKWITPINLGQYINSSGNEVFPFLQNDSVLYFSSSANRNMGGLDVFYSIRKNREWSKPVNLGYPINSSMDDFGFIIDEKGTTGYFNSNRMGADMIYSFTKGVAKIKAVITLVDNETKGTLRNVPVNLFSNNVKIETDITDNNGTVSFILQPDKKYKISTGNNSFYYKELDVNTNGARESNTKYFRMGLDQILLNLPQENSNIAFEHKSSDFAVGSDSKLEEFANKLINNPTLRIEIVSHTSSVGSKASNNSLTTQRANNIKTYLVSRGVDSGRISAIGMGESSLINHCVDGILCLEEEHAENERIEIKVIGFMP